MFEIIYSKISICKKRKNEKRENKKCPDTQNCLIKIKEKSINNNIIKNKNDF